MKYQKWTGGNKQGLILGFLYVAAACCALSAEGPGRTLTTVAAVRSLSAAEAEQQHPVRLRGVVTFYDDALYSRFLQDETAGIYLLELTNAPALLPGQLVEVEGTTAPGEYAPVVQPTSFKVVGEARLPAAIPVTIEELISGRDDSQFVEFSGIVRSVRFEKDSGYYVLDFAKGIERFSVFAKQLPVSEPQDLVESTLKVRGVCATMFNHQRQLFGIRLLAPKADGLVVVTPAPTNPFDQTGKKINSLLQFAPEGTFSGRVKVAGTVTFSDPGNAIFVQDDEAGVYCQTPQRELLQPGDQVEVLGFPAKGEYTPILEDAIFRKVGAGTEPKPAVVDVNAILTGVHDCRLVQLPARVLGLVQRGLNRFLLLESREFAFQAYLPQKVDEADLASLQTGGEVMVTGICMIERGNQWQAGNKWRAAGFHLLLRSPEDVVVTQLPAGMRLPDETGILVGLVAIAVGLLLWVVVLRRKLHSQSKMLQQK
ncbi:MAG TPA: hypothetical protein PKA41_01375 [Verrucomicrobiota bacterium]|nr:hypothetical protein [Verrucomicrobiota bacterium]